MPVAFPETEILTPSLDDAGGLGGGGATPFEPGGGGGDDEWYRPPSPRGPSLAMIGMIGLIIAISALFGTLVVAYLARRASTTLFWKPIELPGSLWVSTFLIGVSSLTLARARREFRQLRSRPYGIFLAATGLLGLGFVLTQAIALRQLASQGVFMRANPHSSLLYILTVTHGLHLVGGFSALGYLIFRARRTPNLRLGYRGHLNVLGVSSIYWHFLVILWFVLFTLLVAAQ